MKILFDKIDTPERKKSFFEQKILSLMIQFIADSPLQRAKFKSFDKWLSVIQVFLGVIVVLDFASVTEKYFRNF